MKLILLFAAGLAVVLFCSGCPSGNGDSSSNEADNSTPASSTEETAAGVDGASGFDSNVTVNDGVFQIADVKLGMSYEAWQALYPEGSGVSLESAWVTDDSTGVASAVPSDPELAPYDNAWFINTKMIGYYSDFNLTQDEFATRIENLEEKFGEALTEPPAWVLETPFFEQYQEPEEDFTQHFWVDEDDQEVLMAFRMKSFGEAMFSLINLTLLDGRIENALMVKLNSEREASLAEQTDNGGAEALAKGGWAPQELAAVPEGEFGFDGVFLGAESNLLKVRFEAQGLTAMGMWVDRDWTGRLDGNPMDGSRYPSEAGWFLDGGLVGFMTTVPGTEADFNETTANHIDRNGVPLSDIPDWAQDSDFFSSYKFQGNEEGVVIWCDEASRGMLFLTFDPLGSEITTMLVDVDNYRVALDTTNEAVGNQGHSL